MKKETRRFLGIILSLIIAINITAGGWCDTIKAREIKNANQMVYELNGNTYNVTKTFEDGTLIINITSPSLGDDQIIYEITDDTVTSDYKRCCGKSLSGKIYSEDRKTVSKEAVKSTNSVSLMSITYGTKVYEKYKNNYYYSLGYSGSADYVKIGCNYNYRIRYDTLSSAKKDAVNEYKSLIGDCNGYYNACVAEIGAEYTAAAITLVTAATAAVLAAPEAIAVALIAAGFSGTLAVALAAVYNIINADSVYDDIHDKYEYIKGFGTQI